MTISEYDLLQMKARVDKALGRTPTDPNEETPDAGPEAVLAGKIMKFCKDEAFPHQCFRKSQKAKAFLTPGLTD